MFTLLPKRTYTVEGYRELDDYNHYIRLKWTYSFLWKEINTIKEYIGLSTCWHYKDTGKLVGTLMDYTLLSIYTGHLYKKNSKKWGFENEDSNTVS